MLSRVPYASIVVTHEVNVVCVSDVQLTQSEANEKVLLTALEYWSALCEAGIGKKNADVRALLASKFPVYVGFTHNLNKTVELTVFLVVLFPVKVVATADTSVAVLCGGVGGFAVCGCCG